MVQRIHILFIGFIVAVSFVAFGSLQNHGPQSSVPVINSPSMIPGAEAVRPLATNQSMRVNELTSELTNPGPDTDNPDRARASSIAE